jgi:hypothetical protein
MDFTSAPRRHCGMRAVLFRGLVLVAVSALLGGCAYHYTAATASDPYGFFSGIWHGIIFPYSLLVNLLSWVLSLFGFDLWSDVQIIGRPNTGVFFYYIGFFIGLSSYGSAAK